MFYGAASPFPRQSPKATHARARPLARTRSPGRLARALAGAAPAADHLSRPLEPRPPKPRPSPTPAGAAPAPDRWSHDRRSCDRQSCDCQSCDRRSRARPARPSPSATSSIATGQSTRHPYISWFVHFLLLQHVCNWPVLDWHGSCTSCSFLYHGHKA